MEPWRVGRIDVANLGWSGRREWLVTNGRGGYACGTVAGMLTRRYHGLLVAALAPPVERRLVVAKLEIDVTYDGTVYALATNAWRDGSIAPRGYRLCQSFALVDGVPTWVYACGDALLEQSIAMPPDRDATALALRVVRARGPLELRMRLLVADRDHHGGPLPELAGFSVTCRAAAGSVRLPACGRILEVRAARAAFEPASERYAGFALALEAERGLTAQDDYAHVLTMTQTLSAGGSGGCVVALDAALDAAPSEIVAARRAAWRARVAGQPSPLRGVLAAAGRRVHRPARGDRCGNDGGGGLSLVRRLGP